MFVKLKIIVNGAIFYFNLIIKFLVPKVISLIFS